MGKKPKISSSAPVKGAILLKLAKRLNESEAYRLVINDRGATLSATSLRGLQYAAQALVSRFCPDTQTFDGCQINDKPAVAFRGYLMHLTHYDPHWLKRKWCDKPFDMDVVRRLIDTLSQYRFNYAIIDVEDAVCYRSHPKLARRSTAPMKYFAEIVSRLHSYGIQVIPKLNFAKDSKRKINPPSNMHDYWFRPYNRLPDTKEFFARAFQLIDELVEIAKPKYFHIGMDEDGDRTAEQYVRCVKTFANGLQQRGLRPIQWIDLDKHYFPDIEKKMLESLPLLPKQVILTYWVYHLPKQQLHWVKKLIGAGHTVLGATMGLDANQGRMVRAHTREIVAQGGLGMVATNWLPLRKRYMKDLVRIARVSGRAYWNGG